MPEQNKRFFQAIKDGDVSQVNVMLAENSDLAHTPCQDGIAGKIYQPLAYAYEQKNLPICRRLLEAGADVNAPIFDGISLMGEVVAMGATDTNDKTSLALDAVRHDHLAYAALFAEQPAFSFELDNKLCGHYDIFFDTIERNENLIYHEIFARQMSAIYEKRLNYTKSRIKQAKQQKENIEERLDHFKECADKKPNLDKTADVSTVKKFKK